MKRVLKYGPIVPGSVYPCVGRPVHMALQKSQVYVWCEVQIDRWSAHNRRWNVKLVPTGLEYEGHCIGSIAIDDYTFVFHLVADQKLK